MLRPPTAADGEGYLRVFLRPEVNAWLRPDPFPSLTAAEVRAMLGDDLRHWNDHGFGPWAVLDDESRAYLGRVGLRCTFVDGEEAVELARELGLPEVIALALPTNFASRAVAEKIGLPCEGKVVHAGLPHLVYRQPLAR